MKTSVIFASALVGVASAAMCDQTALANLTNLATTAGTCQAEANYTLIPPTALPTPDQVKAICSKCTDLLKAIGNMTFPDCDIAAGNMTINVNSLLKNTTQQCASMANNASAGANKTNSSTPTSNSSTPAPTKSAAATPSMVLAAVTAVTFSVAALLA